MPREKSRRRSRDRRSSSYSSESSHDRKKSKRRKRRTRSRERSESTSYRRKRSTSRSRYKRRSYSRSVSRDRYDSKSRRSTSRSRSKPSKHLRDRSNSRSSSHSRSKYKSSKKQRKRSRSTSSRSSSFDIEPRKPNLDDTDAKIEKAIKAAEAAGLTMTKIPTYEYKEVQIKEDMPTIHDRNLLAELNTDSFVQKSFTSSRNKKQSQNIVIDLNSETVQVPESEIKVQNDDSIINFDEIPSQEELKEMWIKKLYQYRKKMLRDELQ